MRALRNLLAAATISAIPAAAHAQTPAPAKADTAKIDVIGKWAFSLEGPFSGSPTITFATQKGDSITGQYISQAIGTHDFKGTLKDRKIAFSFTAESGGQSFVMAFAGKVEDADTMKGDIDLQGMAQMTFTGKRVKP
jgi:hypothetical protein